MNKQRRWDEVFDLLVSYKNEYGNCLVPANFIINDYNLGEWVRQQRKLLKNPNNDCKRYKVKKLNSINFIWDENEYNWDEHFQCLKEYKDIYGICYVPRDTEFKGFKLYNWCRTQEKKYKNGTLKENRLEKLNSIGFIFDRLKYKWDLNYNILKQFKRKYRRLPSSSEKYEDYNIGIWLYDQLRYKDSLTEEQIKKLKIVKAI